MKGIYIAGAISDADVTKHYDNKRRMIQLAKRVSLAGYSPFVPCLDEEIVRHMTDDEMRCINDKTFYYERSMVWLEKSDAVVLVAGWEDSNGTHKEIARANKLGIPVYISLEKLMLGEKTGRF